MSITVGLLRRHGVPATGAVGTDKPLESMTDALGAFPATRALLATPPDSESYWLELVALEPALRNYRVWEAQYPGVWTRWFPSLARLRAKLRHGATVVLWQWSQNFLVQGHEFDASRILVNPDRL